MPAAEKAKSAVGAESAEVEAVKPAAREYQAVVLHFEDGTKTDPMILDKISVTMRYERDFETIFDGGTTATMGCAYMLLGYPNGRGFDALTEWADTIVDMERMVVDRTGKAVS